MDEIDKMLKKLEQVNEDQHQRMEKLEQEKLSLQRYIDELLVINMNMAGEIERLKTTENELKNALVKASNLLIDFTGNCPLGQFDEHIDCDNCYDEYLKCWEKFLLKEDSKERNVK